MKKLLLYSSLILSTIIIICYGLFFSGLEKEMPKEEVGMLPASDRKYSLKSAIITMKSSKQVLGSDIESTIYIDDYGDKYCSITDTKLQYKTTLIVTRSVSITKNDLTYTYNPEKSSGTKSKNRGNFNPMHVDFAKMNEQTMQTNGITKQGTTECLGRVCDVFVLENPALDMKGRYEVWNKIPLRLSTQIGESQIEMYATDLQENIEIPQSVFAIPDSIQFIDVANPLTSSGEQSLSDSVLNLPSPGK